VYLKWLEKTLETTSRLKKPSDDVLMKILELQNKSSRVNKIMKEIPPTPEDLNRTKKLPSHVLIDEHDDHKVLGGDDDDDNYTDLQVKQLDLSKAKQAVKEPHHRRYASTNRDMDYVETSHPQNVISG